MPWPIQMSTMPTEGASFSIALASSTVRFGRRIDLGEIGACREAHGAGFAER